MNSVLPTPLVQEGQEPIDLLNRAHWLDKTEQILNTLSQNKLHCTFALTAPWGTGKTFVLDLLERRLLDYKGGTQYLVFQYNCWKNDYYEEPLIAIVAAFLDYFDDVTRLLTPEARTKVKKAFVAAKTLLTELALGWVKTKTSVDVDAIIDLTDTVTEACDKITVPQAEYDPYLSFRTALQSAQKAIEYLAQDRTVVIMVDELDRCLPEYAIRVLERLHHLFFGINNTVVLLSVDEDQLEHTVKQIFGPDTKTQDYLKKFIRFKIPLSVGQITGKFEDKFCKYFSYFNKDLINTAFNFDEFFSVLFSDVDARTQECIMERVATIHSTLFPVGQETDRKDYSFLCFELIWTVFKDIKKRSLDRALIQCTPNSSVGNTCRINPCYFSAQPDSPDITKFHTYLQKTWSNIRFTGIARIGGNFEERRFYSPLDIPHLLLYYFHQLDLSSTERYHLPEGSDLLRYAQNVEDLKSFILLSETIL